MKSTVLAAVAAAALFAPVAAFACSAEDVADKVAAVATTAQYQALVAGAVSAEETAKVEALNAKVSEAGALASAMDYEAACAKYAEIETELGLAAPEATDAAAPVEAAPESPVAQ